jgi:hypothetical protein
MSDINSIKLKLEIVEGRVCGKDSSGLSDSFCIVNVDGFITKTKVIKGRLDPRFEWMKEYEELSPLTKVEILVQDKDGSRARDIGQITFCIKDFLRFNGKPCDSWLALLPTTSGADPMGSKLHVIITVEGDPKEMRTEENVSPHDPSQLNTCDVTVVKCEGLAQISGFNIASVVKKIGNESGLRGSVKAFKGLVSLKLNDTYKGETMIVDSLLDPVFNTRFSFPCVEGMFFSHT